MTGRKCGGGTACAPPPGPAPPWQRREDCWRAPGARSRCGSASVGRCCTRPLKEPPRSRAPVSDGEGTGRDGKEGPLTRALRFRRRRRRDRGSDGPGSGRAGAELRAGAHQLRPGRVLAVAGGGAPPGLRISFTARPPRAPRRRGSGPAPPY